MSQRSLLVLKNVNAAQILAVHHSSNIETEEIPETTLKVEKEIEIGDLLKEKSSKFIHFLDTHKDHIKYWIIMADAQGVLPLHTTKPCWWCRHSFDTHPLGCPLRYFPHKKEGQEQELLDAKFKELNYNAETNDYFETEGIFCSFPCIKAYIMDNLSCKANSRYKDSLTLLTLLYTKFFGKIITIPTAPSWKVSADYGGHLTPKEYRSTFGKLVYGETVNIKRPYMFSTSAYIRETRVRL